MILPPKGSDSDSTWKPLGVELELSVTETISTVCKGSAIKKLVNGFTVVPFSTTIRFTDFVIVDIPPTF